MPALVFDLDGVLVDVSQSFRACIGRTLEAMGGLAVDDSEILELKLSGGFNNDWDVTREMLRRQGIAAERERVIEVFSRIYRGASGIGRYEPEGLICRERWLLPQELLRALAARQSLGIFTGRPRADAEFTLQRFGAREAIAAIVALEDAAAKPDPEGLLRLGAEVYIGDTVDDAKCARAAGVRFIGICPPESELGQLFRALDAQFTAASVDVVADRLLAD
ncbi:MAG: HAD family hydrolase [Terriglobales bacterium]